MASTLEFRCGLVYRNVILNTESMAHVTIVAIKNHPTPWKSRPWRQGRGGGCVITTESALRWNSPHSWLLQRKVHHFILGIELHGGLRCQRAYCTGQGDTEAIAREEVIPLCAPRGPPRPSWSRQWSYVNHSLSKNVCNNQMRWRKRNAQCSLCMPRATSHLMVTWWLSSARRSHAR